jgi:uncharacterized protein YegL
MAKKRLEQVEFADNPEPRCAVVLLLDTSRSMEGQPIRELNKGLMELDQALKSDPLASLRIEVAVITFGGTVSALDVKGTGEYGIPFDAGKTFVTVDQFYPPMLETGGDTPMGEAVLKALSLINDRKEIYKYNGVDYFRPWIFLITDGKPNDKDWEIAAKKIVEEQERKAVLFYAVGVEGADMNTLAEFLFESKPYRLKGLAFQELFQWLSKSLLAVVQSRPDGQIPSPPEEGWGPAIQD